MFKVADQLNIVCLGQIMAGTSTFLERYTAAPYNNDLYKLFVKKRSVNSVVFLHEIQKNQGAQLYLHYPFQGVIFFINAVVSKGPVRALVQQLMILSTQSGKNVFGIPIRVVVVSPLANNSYSDIKYTYREQVRKQLSGVLDQKQIIFVEQNGSHEDYLGEFYDELDRQEGSGIKQTLYTKWLTRGIVNQSWVDQIKLQFKRIYQEIRQVWQDVHMWINKQKRKD